MKKSRQSLFGFLLLRVFPPAAILLLVVGWLSVKWVEESVQQSVRAMVGVQGTQSLQLIETRLKTIRDQIDALAVNELMINGLIDTESRESYLPVFFGALQVAGEAKGNLYLLDYRARIVASNTQADPLLSNVKSWLANASPGDVFFHLDENALILASPVLINGLVEGGVAASISYSELPKVFSISSSGFLVGLKNTERWIWSSDSSLIENVDVDNEQWIWESYPLTHLPGIDLVIAQSTESALKNFKKTLDLQRIALGMLLLALLAAISFAAYVATGKVSKLSEHALRIAEEQDLNFRIDPEGPIELAELANAFNTMVQSLQQSLTSEAYVNAILHSLNEMLFVTDQAGAVTRQNPLAEQFAQIILGSEAGNVQDFFSQGVKGSDKSLTGFVEGYEESPVEVSYEVGEKLLIVAWARAHLMNKAGEVDGYIYVGRDVTEERLLLEQSRLLSRAVESTPMGILMTDYKAPDRPLIYVNEGYIRITGYSREESLGRNCRYLQGADKHQAAIDELREAIVSQESAKVVLKNYRKNGELFWNELTINPVRDQRSEVTHYVGIINDITDRQRLESLKSEFISTVSHEIRTPMTSIHGSLGLIRSGVTGELSDKAKNLLDIAYSSSERLINLINDMLDLEKIEAGKIEFRMQPVQVRRLTEQCVEELRGFASRYDVRIETEIPEETLVFRGDPERMLQVLVNLLSNAVKFSPEGGSVCLRIVESNGLLRFEVEDKGNGIPKEHQGFIFQKFRQADSSDVRKVGGTGLGLSIAKAIVDAHDGEIGFSSEEGVGTTFFVALALIRHAPDAAG